MRRDPRGQIARNREGGPQGQAKPVHFTLAEFSPIGYSEQGAAPRRRRAAQKADRPAARFSRKIEHLAAPAGAEQSEGSSKKGLTLALFRKPFFGIF